MLTFVDPLRYALLAFGDRPAVACEGRERTFAELHDRVRRLATALAARTEPGDRIALWALNSDRYLEAYLAVPIAGRVLVPLNTRWAEVELADSLDDSGTRLLLTDRDPGGLADIVDEVLRIPDDHDALIDSVAGGEGVDLAAPRSGDELAGLFYTGGTTGRSKGVMLSHGNLVANAFHTQIVTPLGPDDRYLLAAPMFHAAGAVSILQSIWRGAQQVVLPAFTPTGALDLIDDHRITATLLVPTMIAAIVEEQTANPRDVSSVRWLSHGASPIAAEVLRRATELFPTTEFLHVYGATETSPLLTGLPHEEQLIDEPLGRSVGRPIMGVSVRVVDDAGEDLPVGEIGEVVARGPNIMQGYWQRPDETARALRDGWYWTGDVGRLDAEGHLFLHDRSKDMIISGGENVYCTEVEDAIYSHPKVLEATVFGIPSEQWGEAVHAVVVRRDESLTEEELIAHCRERIAGYKVPRSVSFRQDPLPVSGPGKVLKRELRAPYWEGRDRGIS
ncbi:MAG: long-chain fatty acid--CoA ligase [Actinomycetota bacterium]